MTKDENDLVVLKGYMLFLVWMDLCSPAENMAKFWKNCFVFNGVTCDIGHWPFTQVLKSLQLTIYFSKSHRNRLNLTFSSDLMYRFQISWKKALQRNNILCHFFTSTGPFSWGVKNAFISCRIILSFCLFTVYHFLCLKILPKNLLFIKLMHFLFFSFRWKFRGVVSFRLCDKK